MTDRRQLIAKLRARAPDVPSSVISQMVRHLGGAIADVLAEGDSVTIPELGTFDIRKRQRRVGLNPVTGERIEIPASSTVVFRPGRKLKDRLNDRET